MVSPKVATDYYKLSIYTNYLERVVPDKNSILEKYVKYGNIERFLSIYQSGKRSKRNC